MPPTATHCHFMAYMTAKDNQNYCITFQILFDILYWILYIVACRFVLCVLCVYSYMINPVFTYVLFMKRRSCSPHTIRQLPSTNSTTFHIIHFFNATPHNILPYNMKTMYFLVLPPLHHQYLTFT